MGWEWSEPEERPCPCGEGTYTIQFGDGDWNRTDERVTMNCSACREQYVRGAHPYKPQHGNLWVKKGPGT